MWDALGTSGIIQDYMKSCGMNWEIGGNLREDPGKYLGSCRQKLWKLWQLRNDQELMRNLGGNHCNVSYLKRTKPVECQIHLCLRLHTPPNDVNNNELESQALPSQ